MRILSIDVGIKNLAFCLLENDKIAKWDVINLAAQDASDGCGCCMVDKNVKCSNLAKFTKRSLDNFNNRCLHHYVYNPDLLMEICKFFKCKFIHTFTIGINIWFIMKKPKVE